MIEESVLIRKSNFFVGQRKLVVILEKINSF
jgi:hypothetical protein